MNFWKKLLGVKKSPKADIAEKESTQPHATSDPEVSSIYDATRSGNLNPLKALLKEDPGFLLRKNENGTTLLHAAAAMGRMDLVNVLLANGADIDAKDSSGRTALHVALSNGHMDVVGLLAIKALPTFSETQLNSLRRFIVSEPIEYNKAPDLAYLLSVGEPTVLPSDYRDANPTTEPSDAGPLGHRFYSPGRGGADSYYDRIREAKGRLQNAERFSCMVQGAVLSLAEEDLDNLARNANSKIVRMAAAKRLEELLRQQGGHK
jgi:hypothetical protein